MAISNSLASRLKDSRLIREAALVGGRWLETTAGGKRFDVTNPADGLTVATMPDLGLNELRNAIDAAQVAQKGWAALTAKQRGAVLRRWYDLIVGILPASTAFLA